MQMEYKVAYRRQGGQIQYRTFQRYKNLLRYVRALTNEPRPDLKPLVSVVCTKRTTGPWYALPLPETEKLSAPTGMIDVPTE